MRKIVILGAGDNGRTVLNLLRLTGEGARVAGFADDRATGPVEGEKVLGTVSWAAAQPGVDYALGIASPADRKAVIERLPGDAAFVSAVHPSVIVGAGVKLGRGVVLNAGVILAHGADLRDFVLVNLASTIGHDSVLHRFVTVSPGVNCGGRVTLGEGVFAGINSCFGQGLEIGAWTKVALGSAVSKSFPAGKVVAGNPARVMGFADPSQPR